MSKENKAGKQTRVDLLQGTLDMLILRTLLFGPLHGHNIAHYIKQTSEEVLKWITARSTRRCSGWSAGAGSQRSGGLRRTTAARSTTALPRRARSNYSMRPRSGSG